MSIKIDENLEIGNTGTSLKNLITNVAVLELSSQFVLSQSGVLEVLPFNKINQNIGNAIEVGSDGKIKIKNGSHFVKVSGQLCFTTGSLEGKEVSVVVNGNVICSIYVETKYNYDFIEIPQKIMKLNEGDSISVQIRGKQGDTIEAWDDKTFLNLEII